MSYQTVFPAELLMQVRQGVKLYDVRETDEYAQGHIPGAVNIPISEFPQRYQEIQQPAVIICATGNRSVQAIKFLERIGFTDLINLSGGTVGWMQEGRSIKMGTEP